MYVKSLIVLNLIHLAFSKPRDLYAGSKCRNSDIPGVCALVTDCAPAFDAVKETGFHDFKRCGFDHFTEIVCCPSAELRRSKLTTTTTTTTTNTTTAKPDDKTQSRGTDPIRKCEKACDNYSKNLPIRLSYHIVGGEDAAEGEYPHMAALGFYNTEDNIYKFDCGGTLISHTYIITAAHCIINVQENPLKIARLGVTRVPEAINQPDSKLDYNVINITVHKNYNWKDKFNDIALVKLEKKVTFTDNIRPACLYTRNDDPEKLVVTGWGALGLGAGRSSILQRAILSPVSLQECNATYQARTSRYILNSQLCAAGNFTDACQGDSGGPLHTLSNRTIMTIAGVTSYGIGCASKYPGIYTRISSYLDWIEEIVWP